MLKQSKDADVLLLTSGFKLCIYIMFKNLLGLKYLPLQILDNVSTKLYHYIKGRQLIYEAQHNPLFYISTINWQQFNLFNKSKVATSRRSRFVK